MMAQQLFSQAGSCGQKILDIGTIVRKLSAGEMTGSIPAFSEAQMRVMEVIFSNDGKPMMLKSIGEKLNLSPGAVSKTVAVLEKNGMIERNSQKYDLRAVWVTPTAFACQYREACEQKIKTIFMEFLSEERDVDVHVFYQVLTQMYKRAQEKLLQTS